MKESIKKMKQELKQLARQIKEKKSQRCKENCGYVSGLNELRHQFRYKHIAYCLTRGRTIEQVDSGEPDMERVKWVMESMSPESTKKLYIVVNETLHPSQQAVQAGHAVAEFLRKHPHTQWSNGHLIYLKDSPWRGNMLPHWVFQECEYAEFIEPDLDSKVTAYALFGYGAESALKQLRLV